MGALVAVAVSLPLALDGESTSSGNSTGIAVLAVVSMVLCYLLLAGLWYFVFRDKARSRRKRESPDRHAD